MHKIILVPLDERPCNYDFPVLMTESPDYVVVRPPKALMGQRKTPGDPAKILEWTVENAKDAEAAVLSVDTLLYSGIVPSRLHHDSAEVLKDRLEAVRAIKEANPGIVIYAFSLIMRNPSYSSAEEEPDYYGDFGLEIHRYGLISHRLELGIAGDGEKEELEEICRRLPPEYLKDYLNRRAVNVEINKEAVRLTADGTFDFLVFPQDDSSPYGFTAKDQQAVREAIRDFRVNTRAYMYPDADGVGCALLARAMNRIEGRMPLVYVKFASVLSPQVIPLYEDRPIGESVKYQILTAGGLPVDSLSDADLVMLVNMPSGGMKEAAEADGPVRAPEYGAFRTLPELMAQADYALHRLGKSVIIADVAYANGGDELLLEMLKEQGIQWEISSYAGWNTAANSFGTCIAAAMIRQITGPTKALEDFLALRYVEDVGYCARVRGYVAGSGLAAPGTEEGHTDGEYGSTAQLIRKLLQEYADRKISDEAHRVVIDSLRLPWNRLFEVGLKVHVDHPLEG